MKILEPGKDPDKVWVLQHRCTGNGNSNEGCNALLELERSDLRRFEEQEYPWRIVPEAVLFKCPSCGALTDLHRSDWPSNHHKLTKFTSAWAYNN